MSVPPGAAPTPNPVSRARDTRVVVVGGGVAGLVAALEWARIGATVTLVEARDRLGGAVETVELDGLPIDLVADALPHGRPEVDALLGELGLCDLVENAAPLPVWLASPSAPLPAATVLGIPANPWAGDVRRIIGWSGAWRAYLDRLRPPLTIGHERSLGRLVRARMGDRVVDRLVAPATRALYDLSPDDIDVDIAAPGLNAALKMKLLPADGLTALEGKLFRVRVLDSGGEASYTYRDGLFRPVFRPDREPDLAFAANLSAYLQLLARQEDPDTLFFNRELEITGDTELGLLVKNMLDAVEWPKFPRLPLSTR